MGNEGDLCMKGLISNLVICCNRFAKEFIMQTGFGGSAGMYNKMFGKSVHEEKGRQTEAELLLQNSVLPPICFLLCPGHGQIFRWALLVLDQQGYSLPVLQQVAELLKLWLGAHISMWVINMWAMAFLRKQYLLPLPR